MTTDRSEVYTFGEIMALFLAVDGPLDSARSFEFSYAGAEGNVALALARLGHRVAWSGRLGDDSFGRGAIRALRAEGVDVSGAILDGDRATGLLIRDATLDRPITVQYHRAGSAGSALEPGDLDLDAIAGARLVHTSGITAMLSETALEACHLAFRAARDAQVTVVLDPNVRHQLGPSSAWRAMLEELTPLCDVVMVGADEARALGLDPPHTWFLDRGVARVVVKEGSHGAWETDGRTKEQVKARQVTTLDPVGAGDAFAAGWISGWLRGLDPAIRLHEAAIVASCVVSTLGDNRGLPDAATRAAILEGTSEVNR